MDPPKRYFYEFCSRNKIATPTQNAIHNALLEMNDPDELEIAFHDYSYKTIFHSYGYILYLHTINTHVVASNYSEKIQSFNNKEEAVLSYQALCLELEENNFEITKRKILSNTQKMLN